MMDFVYTGMKIYSGPKCYDVGVSSFVYWMRRRICVFSDVLALRLPHLGKRELILVLIIRLFDLCLFGFVGFLFVLMSGKGCGL